MIDALHAALHRADQSHSVRVIILCSALDRVFCGGMDLKRVAVGGTADFRAFIYKLYMDTMDIQYRLTKPSIAVINGPARGAGMTLSINCDMIIAADDTDLGYPELDVGVIPAIHYVHLPRQIGRHKAFELLFCGQPIPVAEAARLGIINEAIPRARLMTRAREIAGILAAKSPALVALGRQSFLRANDLDYRRNVENQIETLCNVFETADSKEGLLAFAQKRPPRWKDPGS
jgi:enoyl-CoA hydratase/carnithine racemase